MKDYLQKILKNDEPKKIFWLSEIIEDINKDGENDKKKYDFGKIDCFAHRVFSKNKPKIKALKKSYDIVIINSENADNIIAASQTKWNELIILNSNKNIKLASKVLIQNKHRLIFESSKILHYGV